MAVLTGREIPVNSFGPSLQDQPVLADERVFHAGDGVAAVAAVTEQIAAEALDKIVVEYEPLPAVFDPLEAMREDAPQGASAEQQHLRDQGDPQGRRREGLRRHPTASSRAASRTQMVEHVPLEPHAAIADWDANGRAHHLVDARAHHARRAPTSRAR